MAEAANNTAGTMGWHRVCLNTIVRKEKVLDSERLRILPMGSRVNVVEKSGRRVRIDQPIIGWCSLNSSNGDTILKPLDPNAKVAPTPRSGQAAVSNLQDRVQHATDQIAKTEKTEANAPILESLKQEKAQLEARIKDLKYKNAQQHKVFEDWKKAAEQQTTTAFGTAPKDIQSIAFREDDAIILKKTCPLDGIVLVRCVAKDNDGNEIIGCDYGSTVPPEHEHLKTDGKINGEEKFQPGKNMQGVWLTRDDFKSLVPTSGLLSNTEKLSQENTDLKLYRHLFEGFEEVLEQQTKEFKGYQSIEFTVEVNGEQKTKKMTGAKYADIFASAFAYKKVGE